MSEKMYSITVDGITLQIGDRRMYELLIRRGLAPREAADLTNKALAYWEILGPVYLDLLDLLPSNEISSVVKVENESLEVLVRRKEK